MRKTYLLQIAGVTLLASSLVWVVGMTGGRPAQPVDAVAGAVPADPKVVIDAAMHDVDESMKGDLGMQSNPIVIASSSPSLDRVVAIGTPALMEAIRQIDASPQSGLHEYLLALCVERIAKKAFTGAPGTASHWSSGKQFPAVWRAHLARVPGEVASIANGDESTEQKSSRLKSLGTPAIPFILDEIQDGHGELAPAAEALMQDTVEMAGESPRGMVNRERARSLKGRYNELRAMTLAAAE